MSVSIVCRKRWNLAFRVSDIRITERYLNMKTSVYKLADMTFERHWSLRRGPVFNLREILNFLITLKKFRFTDLNWSTSNQEHFYVFLLQSTINDNILHTF